MALPTHLADREHQKFAEPRLGVVATRVDVDRGEFASLARLGDNLDTTTTGEKLQYTAPAGKTARVWLATWFNNSGTPTVQLRHTRGAAVIVLRQDAASYVQQGPISLESGDKISFEVTVAGAVGANADASFHIEEQRT